MVFVLSVSSVTTKALVIGKLGTATAISLTNVVTSRNVERILNIAYKNDALGANGIAITQH